MRELDRSNNILLLRLILAAYIEHEYDYFYDHEIIDGRADNSEGFQNALAQFETGLELLVNCRTSTGSLSESDATHDMVQGSDRRDTAQDIRQAPALDEARQAGERE